jgi:hypothetical protein
MTLVTGTGSEFPNPVNTGDYFCGTFYDALTKSISEIVHVTAVSGDTLTIQRGQENTLARGWGMGDIFINNLTAGSLTNFVQAGGPPQSSTSVIYVGTDTSSTLNLINVVTNPIPASLQPGMQFNIKVAATNTGPVTIQINGAAAIPVVRSDGSALVGKELTIGQEMIFVYDGTNLVAMYPGVTGAVQLPPPMPTIPPIIVPITPVIPQIMIFYVDAQIGNDNYDGLSNVPGFPPGYHYGQGGVYIAYDPHRGPCKTIQGVIRKWYNCIYPSVAEVIINVANGIYYGGFSDYGQSVGIWHIIGQGQNTVIVAYPPGTSFEDVPGFPSDDDEVPSFPSYCDQTFAVQAFRNAQFDLRNLSFMSVDNCLLARDGGRIYATNCFYDQPSHYRLYGGDLDYDLHCHRSYNTGMIYLYGTQVFNLGTIREGFPGCISAVGGQFIVGYFDPRDQTRLMVPAIFEITFQATRSWLHYFHCERNGLITFTPSLFSTFIGPTPLCRPYEILTGAGLNLHGCVIPGSLAYLVSHPGWVTL